MSLLSENDTVERIVVERNSTTVHNTMRMSYRPFKHIPFGIQSHLMLVLASIGDHNVPSGPSNVLAGILG